MIHLPTPHTAFDRRTECPQCGARDSYPNPRISAGLIHRCRQCHLSYRVDPIHPASMSEKTPAELAAIDASRLHLFERFLVELGAPSHGGVHVDVGASSGYFVEVASKAGWKTVGVELGRSLAETARDLDRRVIVGNAEFIPVQSGTASVVTFWDVLDHFDLPRVAIAEAARVLQPGGTLWLRVRNGAVHEFMRGRRWLPGKLSVLHNNLYSPRCLRKALADAGFEDVRVVVSPTSGGDPYASMKGAGEHGLKLAKTTWDYVAAIVAMVSAGTLIISPSITALTTRTGAPPDHNA